MAKQNQRASYDSKHYEEQKKPAAARVPEVNKVGKNK